MPGFMGIRGIEVNQERRRTADMDIPHEELARRAEEKALEILRSRPAATDAPARSGGDAVGGIMSPNVVTVEFDNNLLTVKRIFARAEFSHLPVVEPGGKLVGILSDKDFLRAASPFFGTVGEQTRDRNIMERKAGTVMTRNPVRVNADTTIREAVGLMESERVSCLPVVEPSTGRLLGIVTWKDVARALCAKPPESEEAAPPRESPFSDPEQPPQPRTDTRTLVREKLAEMGSDSRLQELRALRQRRA